MGLSFKKLLTGVAIASAATSFAYFSLVNAADGGLQNSTAELSGTNQLLVTGVELSGGTSFDFSQTSFTSKRIYSGETSEIDFPDVVDTGTGYFVLSGAFDTLSNGHYSVRFETTDNHFGVAYFAKGGANEVGVTASVEPILRMDLSEDSLGFGDLSTVTSHSRTMTGEVGTNAVDGLTVSITSEKGGLYSDSANHTINNNNNGEIYRFVSTTGAATDDNGLGTSVSGLKTDTSINTQGQEENIYTTNGPELFDGINDFEFDLEAKVSETTPAASDYTDTITYTVTANF